MLLDKRLADSTTRRERVFSLLRVQRLQPISIDTLNNLPVSPTTRPIFHTPELVLTLFFLHVDVQDCGGFMNAKAMKPLMGQGNMTSLVDTALNHLFTVQFRLGFGTPDAEVPWAQYGEEVVNTPAHQQLALEVRPSRSISPHVNGRGGSRRVHAFRLSALLPSRAIPSSN